MAHQVVEIEPKQWAYEEAYKSGKGGYRIGCHLSGNPFSEKTLSEAWTKGWQEAAANDTTGKRRVEYVEEDNRGRDKSERRGGRTNVWRPGRTPREGAQSVRNNRNKGAR